MTIDTSEFRNVIDSNPTAISIHTLVRDRLGRPIDCTFEYVNPSFERQTGLIAAEIVGRRLLDVLPQTEQSLLDRFGEVARSGVPISLESFCRDLRALYHHVIFRHKPDGFTISSKSGETLNILAGGMAHDFNNILTGISGQLEFAQILFGLGQSFEAQQWLKKTTRTVNRAKGVTRPLLNYLKGQTPEPVVTNLGSLLEEWVDFALAGAGLEVSVDIAPDLWPCRCDQVQIGRVVHNLLLNARQASFPGGGIGVRAFNSSQEQDFVAIEVADHGVGIPQERLGHIFDPYYTTKPDGTGLGLSVCHSIVKQHSGSIKVASSAAAGTVFTVYLPKAPQTGELGISVGQV